MKDLTLHQKLKYLLSEGWKLVGWNTLQSPCGQVTIDDIDRAYWAWQRKLEARRIIENHKKRS
jgi:hypothetical protein